ncbi:MAG: polysaccharide biosynthesis protein [Clostridia bacterium]|nr:polysaccharide biosynthesis protein [Clostridia bacterium]
MAGVFTIMFAQVFIKLLGFLYRHVLIVIPEFGDEGSGLYGIGFNIYMLLLTVATVGIPGAISKLVSNRIAKGELKEAKHIFKIALLLFTLIGLAGTIVMLISAKSMASLAGNEAAAGVLIALAPSVVFVAIAAVIRGYFNGMYNMKPASFNQALEQIFKAGLTILFVYMIHYIFHNQADVAAQFGITESNVTAIMAVWANVATTVSTAIGLLYLFVYFRIHRKDIDTVNKEIMEDKSEIKSLKSTIKMILSLSIPMSLASIVSAINRNIDSFTVNNILQDVLPIINPTLAGNKELIVSEATRLYGILAGKVDMLIGLPLSINIAFATALVPAITEAISKKNEALASKRISYSLKLSILIALPCSIGLMCLAGPILELLFQGQIATSPEAPLLLQISSLTILFTVVNQTINASLQGIGKLYVPALALLCGVAVKLVLNLVLIRIPEINVYGAAISSICCHLIATIIVFCVLRKNIKLELSLKHLILKPVIAVTLMAVFAMASFYAMKYALGHSSRIMTIVSLIVAVIVYLLSVVKLNVLSKEDYNLLPGGEKIYKILSKIKLVK